jgi:stage II sporulation protein AA (anti-sigma F factor antagonist)
MWRGYTGGMTEVRYAIRRETDTAARVTRLHLIGRLDKAARPGLRRAVSNALARRRGMTLQIDMSAAIFLGSECVQELLSGYGKAMIAGHGYEVVEARGHIRRSLAAVRLCAPGGVEELLDDQPWPEAVWLAG